jgi:rubredoxin
MCESCRHIKDPAKDIFIRTYAAGTQNEYHNEAKARYCPVCGCDLKDRATEKQERRDNAI